MNGSFMTSRSNQKWTPVMGETSIFSRLRTVWVGRATSRGQQVGEAVVRHGEDVGVGGFFAIVIELTRD